MVVGTTGYTDDLNLFSFDKIHDAINLNVIFEAMYDFRRDRSEGMGGSLDCCYEAIDCSASFWRGLRNGCFVD